MMKSVKWMPMVGVVMLAVMLAGCGPSKKKNMTVGERRQLVKEMEFETLQQLYEEKPDVKRLLEKSPGYGVFSNANVNVILVSAGGGYGVVKNNETGQRTYMKMALGGIGLGLGAKDYRVIMIFKNKYVMQQFVDSGWQFGGHADAAAKAGEKGAEASGEGDFHSDVAVYSITESGLTLQATLTGAKFWKDDELN